MRIGTVGLWRDDVEEFRREVRAAEELGFEISANGDSQSVYREAYVTLAVAAMATSRVRIGTMVTNPVTRHPAVTASAVSSIDRLSDGRALLGIGTGDSALRNIGERPARIAEMAEYVQAIRGLQTDGVAEWRGREVRVQGLRQVPIWITAEGPRMLQLAGRLADVVVLHSGTSDDAVGFCRSQLREGSLAAGREPDAVEVWMMLKTSIADSREEAIEAMKMGLAASAHHAYRHSLVEKGVPADLVPAIETLIRHYDPSHHEVAEGRNASLTDELGLTDFLADSFGLIGTPAECVAKLDRLEEAGVTGVLLPAIGPNPLKLLHRIGEDIIRPLTARGCG